MSTSPKPATVPAVPLAELQRAFQAAVLHPDKNPPSFIAGTGDVSAAARFRVYTEAYRLRLIEALAADYPALRDCLGDEEFGVLGRAYADAFPSDQRSIRWFGRHLPGYLRQTPPYTHRPGLAELADFEWALSEAFDAPDSAPVDHACLAALDPSLWPALRLRFQPSLRRVDLRSNAPQVWQASNRKAPLPALSEDAERRTWIVWRRDLRLLFRYMSSPQAAAFGAFRRGRCFAEACEALCEWLEDEQVALNAARFLTSWVRDGWITGVEV